MASINTELYEHFFQHLDEVVPRVVTRTSQDLQQPLSSTEYEMHQELLYHLFQTIKKELDRHESTSAVNLDYDPADVLSGQGYDLDEMVMLLSHFRLHAIEEIEREFQAYGIGSLKEAFYFMHRMSDIFDQAVKNSTTHFNNEYQRHLQQLEEELLLLSAPLVPVKEGVFVLPVVGSLSEERTDHIIQTVLPGAEKSGIETLILDFSGTHRLDVEVAPRLSAITRAVQLIGVRPVLTGIRPDMAQSAVERGGRMDHIDTYRDVKRALEQIVSL